MPLTLRARGHVRVDEHETVFLHVQVGDPVDVATTPEPFFTCWLTHIRAPVFIALTGLGIARWNPSP